MSGSPSGVLPSLSPDRTPEAQSVEFGGVGARTDIRGPSGQTATSRYGPTRAARPVGDGPGATTVDTRQRQHVPYVVKEGAHMDPTPDHVHTDIDRQKAAEDRVTLEDATADAQHDQPDDLIARLRERASLPSTDKDET